MKITTHVQDVEKQGVIAEGEFTIKGSAQAFEILSSGLYSDKVLAVVRELSCNAVDAHIEANKEDEPFLIHLPNRLEPFFSVTDNGIGLSHDDVMGLYTTYFDSTKDNSNDFIGAFGLGSKSPFSYSDRFEVTSRFEGMKRVYQIFINDKGIPAVALFAEANTDECNGLQVKLTIRPEDFSRFRDRTRSALKYFPVKPTINAGDGYFNFDALPDSAVEEDGWIAYKRSGNYHQNFDLVAIQGHVPYKVDTSQLKKRLNSHEMTFIRGTQLALKFGIGELDIVASREELQYTEKSLAALETRCREIIRTVAQLLDKRAWKFNRLGYWAASIELGVLSSTLFGRNVFDYVSEDDVKCPTLRKYLRIRNKIDTGKLELHDIVLYSPAYNGRGFGRQPMRMVQPEKGMAVMINDMKVGGIKRTKQWLSDNAKTYQRALVINRRRDLKTTHAETEFDKEIKKIENLLGKPTVLQVSTVTNAMPTHKRPKVMFTFDSSRNRDTRKRMWWKKLEVVADVDVTDGGFFIPLYKGTQIRDENDDNVNWSYTDLKTYLPQMLELLNQHAQDIGVEQQKQIYAIPSLSMKEVMKHGNWHNAFALTKKYVKKHATSLDFIRRFENTEDFLDVKARLNDKWFLDMLDELSDTSEFKLALEPMRNAVTTQQQSKYVALLKSFIKAPNTIQPYYRPSNLTNRYPMLSFITGHGYNAALATQARWRQYFTYITLIDEEDI